MNFLNYIKSANLLDVILIIIPIIYIAYCTYLSIKVMVDDIRKPFLGVISGYLFVYLSVGTVLSVCLIYGFIEYPYKITKMEALLYYVCNVVSLYNMTIFLVKKYVFNKVKNESLITMFLILFLFLSLAVISLFFPNIRELLSIRTSTNMIDYLYYLTKSTALLDARTTGLLTTVRVIPLIILVCLWFYSISKPYNKDGLSFYTKSANKPVFLFLMYQMFLAIMPYLNYTLSIDIVFMVIIIFMTRLFFLRELIKWLKHNDMERIEKFKKLRKKGRYDD